MSSSAILLFACCIPVKGHLRAILYDLNRKIYHFIPNDLANILFDISGKTRDELYLEYSSDDHETLDEYFCFLEEKEVIFYGEKEMSKLFPPLSSRWEYPAIITNAILDIDENANYDVKYAIHQLELLGCAHLQLRQIGTYSLNVIEQVLQMLKDTTITSIDIFLPYSENIEAILPQMVCSHKRIQNVFIYKAPIFSLRDIERRPYGKLIFVPSDIDTGKPVQDPSYFTVNIPLYTESLCYNNYLNRKVYLDRFGNIKNAPEQTENYGLLSHNLSSIVNSQKFISLWKVCKDSIHICKDCEFRYMCVDPRVPVNKDHNNLWSFTTPCSYNPYIAKWNYEDGYVPAFKSKEEL